MLTSLQSCQLSDHHDSNIPRSTCYASFWNPTGPCWLIHDTLWCLQEGCGPL